MNQLYPNSHNEDEALNILVSGFSFLILVFGSRYIPLAEEAIIYTF